MDNNQNQQPNGYGAPQPNMQAGMPQQPDMQSGYGMPQQPGVQPGYGMPQQQGMQPGYGMPQPGTIRREAGRWSSPER